MSPKRVSAPTRMRRVPRRTYSVQEITDRGEIIVEEIEEHDASVSVALSGGDLDARWDQAEGAGEETVGGSAPTPDQDVVEEIGAAIGVTYEEGEPLRIGRKERERDEHRWELDPASSEDFADRAAGESEGREPIRKMRHHDQYQRSG